MTTEEMVRLQNTFLAPYMQLATALIGKTRDGGGNMFRHQFDTMAVLIDYGYIDSVLLKASLVHDLIEDVPDFNRNLLFQVDFESHAVYDLVMEVTRFEGESKSDFLNRVLNSGSRNAKILKVADRISNMIALGFVVKPEFISRYVDETERYIFPIAEQVDSNMLTELRDLVDSRRTYLALVKTQDEIKRENMLQNKPANLKFSAVAFDLDGTLYPNRRLYRRLIPFAFKEFKFLKTFGKIRKKLHHDPSLLPVADNKPPYSGSFYDIQSALMADALKTDKAIVKEKIEKLIYRGWEPLFKKVKLFPHVKGTLNILKKSGLKLAMLSDFPPENKIEYLEITGFWDAVICSEATGRLKPDTLPFLKLSEALGLPPEEILYVGNSFDFDIKGAQKAGMKAAWIIPKMPFFCCLGKKKKTADYVFYNYRQLRDFVLE